MCSGGRIQGIHPQAHGGLSGGLDYICVSQTQHGKLMVDDGYLLMTPDFTES